MYAVIQCKGHQYIVTKGSKIVVDSIGTEDKEINNFDVLAVFEADGSHVAVGSPVLKNVTVVADNAGTAKGEKINVLKFKRKNRYERNIWFRPLQTTLLIKEIKLHA